LDFCCRQPLLSLLLHGHSAGESVHLDHIATPQLSATAPFRDAVDLNLAVLNTDLGFNSILNKVGEFEKLAKADRCPHNGYVGNFALHSTPDGKSLIESTYDFLTIGEEFEYSTCVSGCKAEKRARVVCCMHNRAFFIL